MSKIILTSSKAREAVLSGVEKLSEIVSKTMGPKGSNVIVGKFAGSPIITKDGVSVAREVVLMDPVEDLGCQLVKEAAGRTADTVGDGTTTATVLAHEIFKNGVKLIAAGHSPLSIRNGIEWARIRVCDELDKMARPVESKSDLVSVASISANNDFSIGSTIATAFDAVGWSGTVAVEASPGPDTTIRTVDGIEIGSGPSSPAFLTEEPSGECTLVNPRVLIYNGCLTNISECLNLFNTLSKDNIPLLIVARDVKKEALSTLVANKNLGRLNCVCVSAPSKWRSPDYWMEDLAGVTGGTLFGDSGRGITEASIGDLGVADKVIVSRTSTKILGASPESSFIEARVKLYKGEMDALIGDMDRKELRDRLSMLSSKAAIISVGYSTELELREKGDRIDDAMSATRVAIDGGFLPGGGVALIRAASNVDISDLDYDMQLSAKILLDACSRPISQICQNSCVNSGMVISRILSDDNLFFGYNAANDTYGDMYEMGIIDPLMVTKSAFQNASSIASLLITTDAVMALSKDSEWQPPAGWRPPSNVGLNHKY
jgi:chaperonin GroEL